jgi:hypothetical protein
MGRPSPGSASPSTRSFWRLPRRPEESIRGSAIERAAA